MKKDEKTRQTRERILVAAMWEFGKNGYAAASLNRICDSGIPKGLLYHNFKNKDAVYLACIERCFVSLTEYLKEQVPEADLRGYMDARLCFFKENEAEARLFFEAVLQPPRELTEQIGELQKDYNEWNCKLYRKILKTISLRQDVTEGDAIEYFSIVQNMFNGYFSSPVYRELPFSDIMAAHELKLSKILDFMLYGIAKRRDEE